MSTLDQDNLWLFNWETTTQVSDHDYLLIKRTRFIDQGSILVLKAVVTTGDPAPDTQVWPVKTHDVPTG